jgi:hypothetical protein
LEAWVDQKVGNGVYALVFHLSNWFPC